jgi:hypothetical protein
VGKDIASVVADLTTHIAMNSTLEVSPCVRKAVRCQ